MLATFLGTMGLPHVVVRFYTNPDGRAARRTTLAVLALLGAFYVLPPVYAALGRAYGADPATSDSLVLELPRLVVPGLLGDVLTGMVTAGAFAAFLSTSSGLAIAVSGVLTQDVTSRRLPRLDDLDGVPRRDRWPPSPCPWPRRSRCPTSASRARSGLAFAVAASTFCPLLVLGIWWRGLTAAGAVAGLLVGGAGSVAAVAWTLAHDDAPAAGSTSSSASPRRGRCRWRSPRWCWSRGVRRPPGARAALHGAAAHARDASTSTGPSGSETPRRPRAAADAAATRSAADSGGSSRSGPGQRGAGAQDQRDGPAVVAEHGDRADGVAVAGGLEAAAAVDRVDRHGSVELGGADDQAVGGRRRTTRRRRRDLGAGVGRGAGVLLDGGARVTGTSRVLLGPPQEPRVVALARAPRGSARAGPAPGRRPRSRRTPPAGCRR